MKKVLAVVLTVCVIFGTSAAFAQQRHPEAKNFEGREHLNQQEMNRPEAPKSNGNEMRRGFRPCKIEGREGMRDFEGRRQMFTPDMPKEIREKVAELAKLRIDLDEVLTDKTLNREKAFEIHKKMQKLENEINDWRFERRLERIETMKKKIEQVKVEAK